MLDKKFFDNYFNTIYSVSNKFTKKQFANMKKFYDLNYGPHIPDNKNIKILDMGCGTGHFIKYLEDKGYNNILGIDISKEQVEYCKKNISSNIVQIDVFEYLKNVNEEYDLIVANDLIEHIDKEKILDFIMLVYKSLKSSGIFLLKCPNMSNPFSLNIRYKDFTHEIGFTETSLYQVLKLCNFKKIEIYGSAITKSNLKDVFVNVLVKFFYFIIKKLYWWQGYNSPQILSPLLIAKSIK